MHTCLYCVPPTPCGRVSPSNVVQKQIEWRRLCGLLATYEQHYSDNPMFLLQVRGWGRRCGHVPPAGEGTGEVRGWGHVPPAGGGGVGGAMFLLQVR